MEKKISINMENDQVTFIEVDGIRYTTLDEITDLEDRASAFKLISEMTGDDFEASFEEHFEEEFQEMQRKTTIFPKLLASIFIAVSVILLAISGLSAVQSVQRLLREEAVPGRVVDIVEHSSTDTQTGQTTVYSYPVVEFSMPGWQQNVVELQEGSSPPAYKTGDVVTILYDPEQPAQARTKSFSGSLFLWLLPAVTGFVGLVFLIVAVFVFRGHKIHERSAELFDDAVFDKELEVPSC